MNKKQILDIVGKYVNFTIRTPIYESEVLSSNQIEFVNDSVIRISSKNGIKQPDVYIQTKDVKIIIGVERL